MLYTKRKEIINRLECLVHTRFSKERLNEEVNKIFGVKNLIEIDWHCEDMGLADYNAMFTTRSKMFTKEIQGVFDICYLNCRQPNEDGAEVYVTAVGYDW